VLDAATTHASPVPYDDAREETDDSEAAAPAPKSLAAAGSSASGMYIDTCACCAERATVDPDTLLCVPCEADADALMDV